MISWAARSRWTKPMWAAGKPASSHDEDQVDRRDCGGTFRGRGTGRIRICRVEDLAARSLSRLVPNNRGAWRESPNRWLSAYKFWPPAMTTIPSIHFRQVATRPKSSRRECIAWPLWIAVAGASTHGASMPTISTSASTSTFRFNRRLAACGLLFSDCTVVLGEVQHEPIPYTSLCRRSSPPRKPNVGDTRAKWIPSLLNFFATSARPPGAFP